MMNRAEAALPGSEQSPGRILIVDDEPDIRTMLVRVMRRAQHETKEARNGREAVELAREHTFDLVVSDVQMPDMGGVELLRALHEIDDTLPVLLMSGAPDLGSAMKAVEYGAVEYLPKPVGLKRLLDSA